MELPKFSVPTFDGDVLNWAVFWEQFQTAIYNNKKLHEAQKLAYLWDAVDKGPANKVIQGLSQSAGTYLEAVKCLQQRYDRLRSIHQKHVKTIIEAPTVKTGTGKELRQLHDLVSQHLRSLRTANRDTLDTFMSSLIEMKLDQATKFVWQQHMHERRDVPSINKLLEFVDWRALASELSVTRDAERKVLTWKRNPNYEPLIKSTQNGSARHVMRLLIRCTHVQHSKHFHTKIA